MNFLRWYTQNKKLLLSKGDEYDGVYISKPNEPSGYYLIDVIM